MKSSFAYRSPAHLLDRNPDNIPFSDVSDIGFMPESRSEKVIAFWLLLAVVALLIALFG